MATIGEVLLLSVGERPINQKAPDGRAWEKLSTLMASLRGSASATPVFQDNEYLRDSIRYNANSDSSRSAPTKYI